MKEKSIICFSFICKSVLYILVSFILKFNFGKKKLIARKIKLGTAIITLTSMFSSCSGPEDTIEKVTCYEMVAVDSNYIEMKSDSISNDSLLKEEDSVGIVTLKDRVMCYGAPANLNNSTNE